MEKLRPMSAERKIVPDEPTMMTRPFGWIAISRRVVVTELVTEDQVLPPFVVRHIFPLLPIARPSFGLKKAAFVAPEGVVARFHLA